MKHQLAFLFALLLCPNNVVWASNSTQTDSTKVTKKDEDVKLSDSFKKALDGAFSFGPTTAPLPKQDDPLTTEQLHEWVGEPTETDKALQAEKFDSTYKALKMWEKEFYTLLPLPTPIDFNLSFKKSQTGCSFDFGEVLGNILIPKQRRLKKLHDRTEKIIKQLDREFPMAEKR